MFQYWKKTVFFFANTPFRRINEQEARRVRILVASSLLLALFTFVNVVFSVFVGFWPGVWVMGITCPAMLANAFLFKYTKIPNEVLGNRLVFVCYVSLASSSFFTGGLQFSPVMSGLILLPALALNLVSRQAAIGWTAATLATLLLYFVLLQWGVKGYGAFATPYRQNGLVHTVVYSGFMLVLVVLSYVPKRSLDRAFVKLKNARDEAMAATEELTQTLETVERQSQIISQTHKDLTASISYAQRIQEALLPTEQEVKALLPESFLFFRPRDIVSGDFYFVRQVGLQTVVAVVDCTGHGVPGAIMSVLGSRMLEEITGARRVTDPATILRQLHQGIQGALRQPQSHNLDGMDAAICTLEANGQGLHYAGAQRSLYYVQGGQLYKIKGLRRSLGGSIEYTQARPYETHYLPLEAPTWCYLFTDGLQDQFGGPEGKKLLKKRLLNTLLDAATQPAAAQHQQLAKAMSHWQGKSPQVDDMLLLGFCAGPSPA